MASPTRIVEKRMNGFVRGRNHAEIGPDRPIENVGADDLQRRLRGMHRQRPIAHVANRVDHERHAGEVIKVGMCYEYVIDLRQFGDRQIAHAGAGVDQDVVVDQQRGRTQMASADPTATSENSDFHPCPHFRIELP
jgi:hypothetical protein